MSQFLTVNHSLFLQTKELIHESHEFPLKSQSIARCPDPLIAAWGYIMLFLNEIVNVKWECKLSAQTWETKKKAHFRSVCSA